jgi:hypothetical protein
MRDTAGDGWSGNFFDGFGIRVTMSGTSRNYDFTTPCPTTENSTDASNSTAPATVSSNVAVGKNKEGGSKSEIRWKINCGGADLQNDG